MPGKNDGKIKKFLGFILVAAVVIVVVPLVGSGIALSAASDAPAIGNATVSAMPPAGLGGDPIAQPVTMPTDPTQAALVTRGEYLAVAGDCQECHSITGGPAYGGGQYMNSPVGAVFTPNITPSQDGIGGWTDQQFWNALHEGIGPGSSLLVFPHYLLPSMPYDATSKLSYQDVMAIKAYLDSLPPANVADRPSQIPFPFNIRAALLGWRILFFRPEPMQYDPSWSPSVRNGAYLVQALAHCSDCHTPRNPLFASEYDKFLGGGQILAQSWYAPNITSQKTGGGVGGWSSADLVDYLSGDGALGVGAPVGPMKQVVEDSLSRLPKSDVQDIANYLQTGTTALPSAAPSAAMPTDANGAAVYAENCARCHGANGEGVANNFPNLAGNQSLWDGPPNDIISMVLGGYTSWHPNQSAMPSFRATLTDDQIAAVANYIRTNWGNQGVADATGDMVADLRPVTDTVTDLNTGNAQASFTSAGATQNFGDISGAAQIDGKFLNCMIQAHFGPTDPSSAGIALSGACAEDGGALTGQAVVNGQTVPFRLQLQPVRTRGEVTGLDLHGPLAGGNLDARISLVTPNDGIPED
jgi:mono/diheme cytochrome c family protein